MTRELSRKIESDSGGASEVDGPGGILTGLWLRLLLELNLPLTRFEQMLDQYTEINAARVKQDYSINTEVSGKRVVKINTAKANLRRALLSSATMTIRTLFIGFKILGASTVTISFKLTWPSGRRTVLVERVVNLGKVVAESEERENEA